MEDYLELFKPGPYQRVNIPGGQTEGYVVPTGFDSDPENEAMHTLGANTAYAISYQQEEERIMNSTDMEVDREQAGPSRGNSFMEMEELSSCGTRQPQELLMKTDEELTDVYRSFNFDTKPADDLPIFHVKEKIIQMVETYSTVIIEGSTGCGKTTQVPQYIFDSNRTSGKYCNIVVTQPRRIAATSIATRVASERKWPLGSLVGYKIGLNERISEDTRILYCTTGVLLQTIIADKNLNRYTHIILDEVHERDQKMDFLLLLIRKMQRTNSRQCKVVLQSATINTQKFSQYFASKRFDIPQTAPIVPIPTNLQHEVKTYYLDDLGFFDSTLNPNLDDPHVSQSHHRLTLKLIESFDTPEERNPNKIERGSVLVFLPGIMDIEDLYKLLSKYKSENRWIILPLHSSITREEQSCVFRKVERSHRKIILATNIAESSITVPDIKFVIDYCMTKQLVTDPSTNFTSLKLTWAAQSNCVQRAGRAGRVSSGKVFRLVHQEIYNCFPEEEEPEMRRCPLSQLILLSKLVELGEPKALLAVALDPPDLRNIEKTILLLKEAGGLLMTAAGKYSKVDGDITFLGRIMARLPLDIHISKMIALGHIFGVLEACVIMGAAMTVRNMFSTPFQSRLEAFQSKLAWSSSSSSDPIAFCNAFSVWKRRSEQGYFERTPQSSEARWANRYFIEVRSLREVNDLVIEVQKRLRNLGIEQFQGPDRVAWADVEQPLVLKLVMAGAFYPNYFVRGSQGGQVDEKSAVRELVGRDPYSTVYLQGVPQHHPKKIYAKRIKEMLSQVSKKMKVTFDDTKKVYVEFPRPDVLTVEDTRVPGRVALPVYLAVKMRQLKIPFHLDILSEYSALKRFEEMRQPPLLALSGQGSELLRQHYQKIDLRDRWQNDSYGNASVSNNISIASTSQPCNYSERNHLPRITTTCIQISIVHVESCGRFWALDLSICQEKLDMIRHYLNSDPSNLVSLRSLPHKGQLVAACFNDKQYYRARVLEIGGEDRSAWVKVHYIDYGNVGKLPLQDIKDFNSHRRDTRAILTEPGFAMECTLAKVQPSLIKCCGQWSEDANKYFKTIVEDVPFYAYVYSVVNSVVSLIIYINPIVESGNMLENSLNLDLIKKKLAQEAQESYLSSLNREIRDKASKNILNQDEIIVYEDQQHSQIGTDADNDPEPPSLAETSKRVELKGPFSPLEMKIFHLIRGGMKKSVHIDPSSVNSVLIDDDPQDCHERLLVAGSVQASQDGNRLTLRQTTIMPSVPGFPAIACLLFAHQAELRVDSNQEHITGALFGLGCNEKNEAYFPEHDMEVTFDTKLDLSDIRDVNRLRFWMSTTLHTDANKLRPDHGSGDIILFQRKVKEFLHKLLSRKREYQTPKPFSKEFKWGLLPKDSLLVSGECKLNGREIFPLHCGVSLEPEGSAEKQKLANNARYLLKLCDKDQFTKEERCLMCNTTLQNLSEVLLHVHGTEHLQREVSLNLDQILDDDYFKIENF